METVISKFLKIFQEISEIPRCSKHETAIGEWLCNWAESHGLSRKRDKAGNVLIKVPATRGYEKSPLVVIQGHMDMVCEKTPLVEHDFSNDGIKLTREGDWLSAAGTTLGADNGVALALAMMLVEEETEHPELELLFTVDEESGLTGVNSLEEDFLAGRLFINLDSEDEGKFTIGCAGGRRTEVIIGLEKDIAPKRARFLKIVVSGLQGGHSGTEIDKNRANALKILALILLKISDEFSFNLVDIKGGTVHNAIPRYAECLICVYPEDFEVIDEFLEAQGKSIHKEFRKIEPDLIIKILDNSYVEQVLTDESTLQAINLLNALPHGVTKMSEALPGLVESSCNLARVNMDDSAMRITVSLRSSITKSLEADTKQITELAEAAGVGVEHGVAYPAWEPNKNSPLAKKCQQVYEDLFGKKPKLLVIHAGLECSVIGKKYPDMDMISFGPTILNPHSPRERLDLPSITRTWELLQELLKNIRAE
jgi:dipeptidase D